MIEDHGCKPPSFFRLNEFTWAFYEIVATYGTPNYKEVNPSVFAIVTFPFLFGIMFGDIGHGTALCLIGALMCIFNEPIKRSAPALAGALKGRYLFLLMGFFAAFCGLMYNDFMAIPLYLFDSCYEVHERIDEKGHILEDAHLKHDCTYPVGIDPMWYSSRNSLTYINSLKMKLSVILGVMQMSLGVCMKAFNSVYFKNKLDFLCEFVP
jgi:V-type H+-transporting ATPase subunit a